jgi:hypothetical protein
MDFRRPERWRCSLAGVTAPCDAGSSDAEKSGEGKRALDPSRVTHKCSCCNAVHFAHCGKCRIFVQCAISHAAKCRNSRTRH